MYVVASAAWKRPCSVGWWIIFCAMYAYTVCSVKGDDYFVDSCTDGDIRHLGAVADSPRMSIVEVCRNGNYSTICSQSWGNEEASVVCAQLGFSSRGAIMCCLYAWIRFNCAMCFRLCWSTAEWSIDSRSRNPDDRIYLHWK